MNIVFKKVSEFHRGILFALLKEAYSYHSEIERTCGSDWQNGDNFFFDHLHLADKCGFITTLHGEAIGFISWNPGQSPEYVELGNNCIITKWKRNGFGKLQLQEAIHRIVQSNVKKIVVTKDSGLISAQRMYESMGFTVCGKRNKVYESGLTGEDIEYEYLL